VGEDHYRREDDLLIVHQNDLEYIPRVDRQAKIAQDNAVMPIPIKTSETDPLRIGTVELKAPLGRVGVTFCPGKKDPHGGYAHWDRDLAKDLDVLHDWGTATVITLLEEHEFDMLKVRALGREVRRRHMNWIHLPVRDLSIPNKAIEEEWQPLSEGIRATLRSGFDVVFHCRGGLGRAGTMAARTLVELGLEPDQAIGTVRRIRPGAVQTAEQEGFVQRGQLVPEHVPGVAPLAVEDRAIGALLGLAVGDAVGTTLEFKARDSCDLILDMAGGGPFNLEPGQWTDDTAMALALADSLLENGDLDERDLMGRFVEWWQQGRYSCTFRCFDIGTTTRRALERWLTTNDPNSGSTDPSTAGNGSLMRLAPVAIRHWKDRPKLRDVAARQSRTTHAAPEAIDACKGFADMLADAIAGKPRSEVLSCTGQALSDLIASIMAGSWRGKHRPQIRSSGYVAHTLEAAIWSVARTTNFKSAVLLAANLGEDADTTAAVAGQLAGALYGASGIPEVWRQRVAWSDQIQELARRLLQHSRP
jgi:ADP-ribosyl-[dinitrogen reductase] hydrolase